jgi:hypothetical protein
MRFKAMTILTVALATAFYSFFMFAKHDPSLSAIAPFLNDPYDAIGSFAAIASVPLVLLALLRAFRPYRTPPTTEQQVYLIRTQLAIALAALVTLAGDAVAMARHTGMWLGTPLAGELLALLGGMTVFALVVIYLVRRAMSTIMLPTRPRWRSAVTVSLLAILLLAVYPEAWIQTLYGHLFTILMGILLFFAPLSQLDVALSPFDLQVPMRKLKRWRRGYSWIAALLFALGVGLLVFLAETSEGGGQGVPLARVATIFAVFVGTGTVGILIGYAFLRRPLGLR